MPGRIKIVDNDMEHVGDVLWTGGAAAGSWRFSPSSQLDELSKKRVTKQIKDISVARTELRAMKYRSPSGVYYRGWSGFTGVLGALVVSLPAIAMKIDSRDIVWPEQNLPEEPLGIDTDAERRQDDQLDEYESRHMDEELAELQNDGE